MTVKLYVGEYPGLAATAQGDSVLALPQPPTAEQVVSTATGAVRALGAITAGSGYADSLYRNVPLTGGTGSGATANIKVVSGAVTAVTLVAAGTGYTVADVLSATDANLGGAGGSGFHLPVATLVHGVATHGAITAGSGYTSGSYAAVALTGGTGTGATANITVAGGAVTVVTIVAPGSGYTVADVLSAADANLGGGGGSGFSTPVATLTTGIATFGAITGGSGYKDSLYYAVPLTGGTGAGATANIRVVAGAVTAVTLVAAGNGYTAGDSLSAADANLGGGGGSLFAVAVSTTSTFGAAFADSTVFVELEADSICSVAFGTAPSATTSNMRMAAGERRIVGVPKGQKYTVAVIANT